ncbi:MAG TPA: hypothetical protein VLW55_05460 [Burkholderiaceae bacterium]|nr:hypothetical protein [Burkholderiaceae bacterium]
MAKSKQDIPAAAVVLHDDEGRIEVTVVDGEIWLSDYGSGKHNFTLVIPRMRLKGNKAARDGVYNHHCNKTGKASVKLAATTDLTSAPPAKAGYWYQLASPAHGGPVVIIEE